MKMDQSLPILIIWKFVKGPPTVRLKAVNKYGVTHIMYVEIETVIRNLTND